jgi:HPt (histidine-containing phosphotransfer) domain-containing protein
MDVQMPRLDGFEATRRIRARGGLQPWIVAVTANATDDDRRACRAAGMDDYLGKPIRPDELVEALRVGHEHRAAAVGARTDTGGSGVSEALPVDDGPQAPSGGAADGDGAPAPSVIDRVALERLVELTGDRAFVHDLASAFPGEATALLDRIRAAHPGQPSVVRRHAHSLKSSAANLGAGALAAAAARLEAAVTAGDPAVPRLIDDLAATTRATVAALEELGGR